MKTLSLAMSDGTCDALLWAPTDAQHAVIWSCDALGIRPAAVDQAQRLASWGVAVLMPNLFWRTYRPPLIAEGSTVGGEDEAFAKNGGALYQSYDFETNVASDAPVWAATLRETTGLPTVSFIGFCMGGRVGLRTAATLDDQCTMVTAFHPGGLVRDEPSSEHLMLDQVGCPVYFGYADDDPIMTAEHQRAFRAAADEAGLSLTDELYPEARHGYMMADRPVFHPAGAERGWTHLAGIYR